MDHERPPSRLYMAAGGTSFPWGLPKVPIPMQARDEAQVTVNKNPIPGGIVGDDQVTPPSVVYMACGGPKTPLEDPTATQLS